MAQWPSSQSLNYYVHVIAQFLQTNEMFAAIALIGSKIRTTSPFSIFLNPFQINIEALFCTFCLLLKTPFFK